MATSDTFAFWIVLMVLIFINIVTPLVMVGFNYEISQNSMDSVEGLQAPSMSDYFAIGALNILAVPFWTFGFPYYINLFIMIPIRILGWILLLRMIRGN